LGAKPFVTDEFPDLAHRLRPVLCSVP